jgi:hypothetical protein
MALAANVRTRGCNGQRHRIAVLRVGEFRFEHDRNGVLEHLLGLLGLANGA